MRAPSRSTSFLLLLTLAVGANLVARDASALVTLQENSTSGPIHAESCSGTEGGICGLTCSTSCDGQGSDRVQVSINQCVAGVSVGSRIVTGDLNTDIMVEATPETMGNAVLAQVEYTAWWHGSWCMGVSLEQIKSARANVWLDVIRLEPTPLLLRREVVHSLDVESQFNFFGGIVGVGIGKDEGSRRNSFTVLLERGARYRLRLRLQAETELSVTTGFLGLDYKGDANDKGAGWTDLRISVGQDARGAIGSLAARIDTLEHKLENHGHVYLTGHGVGHNNVEAQTGTAIFFDDDGDLSDLPPDPEDGLALPTRSMLYPSAPNPTGATSTIAFDLPTPAHVNIQLYDVSGRTVRTLVDESRAAGRNQVELDTGGLASGVYYYRLRADRYVETRKLVVAR